MYDRPGSSVLSVPSGIIEGVNSKRFAGGRSGIAFQTRPKKLARAVTKGKGFFVTLVEQPRFFFFRLVEVDDMIRFPPDQGNDNAIEPPGLFRYGSPTPDNIANRTVNCRNFTVWYG